MKSSIFEITRMGWEVLLLFAVGSESSFQGSVVSHYLNSDYSTDTSASQLGPMGVRDRAPNPFEGFPKSSVKRLIEKMIKVPARTCIGRHAAARGLGYFLNPFEGFSKFGPQTFCIL